MKVRRHVRAVIACTAVMSCGVAAYSASAVQVSTDMVRDDVVAFDASTAEVRNVTSVSSTKADTVASALRPTWIDTSIGLVTGMRQGRSKARTQGPRTLSCSNELAQTLFQAGFRGVNLHEAWAIAMRESHGNEREISSSSDYGLFQFNRPSHYSASWWDDERLLDRDYNARVAFQVSRGGDDWMHWGLTPTGKTDPELYGRWSNEQVWKWITEPYQRYYVQYPCK